MVVVSSSFSAPVEGILLHQPSVKLLVNDQEVGTGNLYITEKYVSAITLVVNVVKITHVF